MKIYFRCVKGAGFYDRIITWYSRSPYSHAEFAWPLNSSGPEQWLGAQPSGGVQSRPENYLHYPYDLFYVLATESQCNKLHHFLADQIGKPYDWNAIAAMGLPFLRSSSKGWFCSELVFYGLSSVGIPLLREPLNDSDLITPRDLAISLMAQQKAGVS